MLNNINSRDLSRSKKASVSNVPGTTHENILEKIDGSLKSHPDTLIVHAVTNDLTKNIKTLRNVIKVFEKTKNLFTGTRIVFSNVIYLRDKRNVDK